MTLLGLGISPGDGIGTYNGTAEIKGIIEERLNVFLLLYFRFQQLRD